MVSFVSLFASVYSLYGRIKTAGFFFKFFSLFFVCAVFATSLGSFIFGIEHSFGAFLWNILLLFTVVGKSTSEVGRSFHRMKFKYFLVHKIHTHVMKKKTMLLERKY